MKMKKFKKPKGSGDSGLGLGGGPINQVIKEPIIFNEDYDFKFEQGISYVPRLIDLNSVIPLGYFTEKFLNDLKLNVI